MLTASHIQFLAEDELITVIPKVSLPKMQFLHGNEGPFESGSPVQICLWLALSLKKNNKVIIQPPEWLRVETIKKIIEHERTQMNVFQKLPSLYFMEIAILLLENAESDVTNDPKTLRSVIDDLWRVREIKIRHGFLSIASSYHIRSVELTNLTCMEINKMRPFLVESLSQFQIFNKAVAGNM
jgi:GINS complex subunit 2